MSDAHEMIERVRRRLDTAGRSCAIAGPVSEAAVAAAEEALGLELPPSYRAFVLRYGALTLPARLGTVHAFVGLVSDDGTNDDKGVVQRTLHARVENHLGEGYVIVGLGAEAGEWYCLDSSKADDAGESPIFLFDVRDNQIDQQFYESFDQMIREVMGFVEEILDEELAPDGRSAGESAYAAG
jgi:hypothetical protein